MLGITNHSKGALALHLMPSVTDSESEGEAGHNLTSSVALPVKATPTEENKSFKSQRQVNFLKSSSTERRKRSRRTSLGDFQVLLGNPGWLGTSYVT